MKQSQSTFYLSAVPGVSRKSPINQLIVFVVLILELQYGSFRLKWVRDARHEAYLNIQEVKGVTRAFTSDDTDFVPLVGFDCRGLDPIDWRPEGGFVITGESGQVWEDVDLSEKEWMEYDEKKGDSVSVMNLQWEFRVHKGK
jgi:hypothetical protein